MTRRGKLMGNVDDEQAHYMSASSATSDEHDDIGTASKDAIHINIPPRFYLVPGAAFIAGTTIGLMRGSRDASLRFLAENAHRPPTTVQGWYFYNKTKNYKVIYGGLKGAAAEASKLSIVALGWVGIEEGLERVGWGQFSEVGAGIGTAGMFSAVCGPTAVENDTEDTDYWVAYGEWSQGDELGKAAAGATGAWDERKSLRLVMEEEGMRPSRSRNRGSVSVGKGERKGTLDKSRVQKDFKQP